MEAPRYVLVLEEESRARILEFLALLKEWLIDPRLVGRKASARQEEVDSITWAGSVLDLYRCGDFA